MSDTDLPDGTHVEIENESGLRHWSRQLGTDPERLRAAVAAVGTEVRRLREFLSASSAAAGATTTELLPDEDPHDANGAAGLPHYDIHKEAS